MAYRYQLSRKLKELLPSHYVRRCEVFDKAPPPPVHWRPAPAKFTTNPRTGERVRLCDDPIDVIYPAESNLGLWGGEGLVQGFLRKNKKHAPRYPVLWRPMLTRRPLYSEILDRWMIVTVTLRTLKQIDDSYGFDNYILKTSEREINSKLGMDLKREMILELSKKTLYTENPEKREKVYNKYKQFVLPVEEAEWLGLSTTEAVSKARAIQKTQVKIRPLKEMFAESFLEDLKAGIEGEKQDESGWLTKLNPFGKKPDQTGIEGEKQDESGWLTKFNPFGKKSDQSENKTS